MNLPQKTVRKVRGDLESPGMRCSQSSNILNSKYDKKSKVENAKNKLSRLVSKWRSRKRSKKYAKLGEFDADAAVAEADVGVDTEDMAVEVDVDLWGEHEPPGSPSKSAKIREQQSKLSLLTQVDTNLEEVVQCGAVQCSEVQCSAVQCSVVQCSAVQCSAV